MRSPVIRPAGRLETGLYVRVHREPVRPYGGPAQYVLVVTDHREGVAVVGREQADRPVRPEEAALGAELLERVLDRSHGVGLGEEPQQLAAYVPAVRPAPRRLWPTRRLLRGACPRGRARTSAPGAASPSPRRPAARACARAGRRRAPRRRPRRARAGRRPGGARPGRARRAPGPDADQRAVELGELPLDVAGQVDPKHPKTQFVTLHFGNFSENPKNVSENLDKYPNMHVDMAARIGELGRQPFTAKKFFEKYQDRILFATDATPHGDAFPQQVFNDKLYEIYYRFLETEDEEHRTMHLRKFRPRMLANLRHPSAGPGFCARSTTRMLQRLLRI